MARKDLHERPFDETTIAKLEIFENYAEAWLPTFIMSNANTVCIFDFFAGTGYDKNGVKGSPIRILEQVKHQIANVFKKKVKIKLFFNEYEPEKRQQLKFERLKEACNAYLENNSEVKRAVELNLYNEDFEELFPKLLSICPFNTFALTSSLKASIFVNLLPSKNDSWDFLRSSSISKFASPFISFLLHAIDKNLSTALGWEAPNIIP